MQTYLRIIWKTATHLIVYGMTIRFANTIWYNGDHCNLSFVIFSRLDVRVTLGAISFYKFINRLLGNNLMMTNLN